VFCFKITTFGCVEINWNSIYRIANANTQGSGWYIPTSVCRTLHNPRARNIRGGGTLVVLLGIFSLYVSDIAVAQNSANPWQYINSFLEKDIEFEVGCKDTLIEVNEIDETKKSIVFRRAADINGHELGELGLYNVIKQYDKKGVYSKELWYKDNVLRKEVNYKNGKLDGVIKGWYNTSNLYFIYYYNDGNGIHFYFDEKGNLSFIQGWSPYSYPIVRGIEAAYYSNVQLKFKHNCELFFDSVQYYFDGGKLQANGLLSFNGARLGLWKDYYINGQIKSETYWGYSLEEIWRELNMYIMPNGENWNLTRKKESSWKLYSKKGKLLIERIYKDDNLKEEKDYRTKNEKLLYPSEEIIPKDDLGEL